MKRTLHELVEMRELYEQKASEFCARELALEYVDHGMSAEGMHFVLGILEDRWHHPLRATLVAPVRVLELGAGFSTVVLLDWCSCHEGAMMWSVEHDSRWLQFIRDVTDDGPVRQRPLVLEARDDFVRRTNVPRFDVAIVDHGPEMQTRADDVPWIAAMMAPDGVMLFDDWRPKHEGRIRRAFAALGGGWLIEAAAQTRRWPEDKAIASVRRP